jgi:hypothetical protein
MTLFRGTEMISYQMLRGIGWDIPEVERIVVGHSRNRKDRGSHWFLIGDN